MVRQAVRQAHGPEQSRRTPHPAGGSPVSKFQTCFVFWSLNTCPVECRLLAALLRRIPQGENLRFVCNLVLGVWDFIDYTTPADFCMKERRQKPPLGVPQSRVLRAPDSLLSHSQISFGRSCWIKLKRVGDLPDPWIFVVRIVGQHLSHPRMINLCQSQGGCGANVSAVSLAPQEALGRQEFDQRLNTGRIGHKS